MVCVVNALRASRECARERAWRCGSEGRRARSTRVRAATRDGARATELSGTRARFDWVQNGDFIVKKRASDDANALEATRKTVGNELARVFLPSAFPTSVSRDYVAWLKWHLVSLLFRDVLEVITAQSLLVALGLGNAPGALPLTAVAKWVAKDGVGSVATLLAGAFGGQAYDEDPKRWWGVTNALEDVARAIELVTPVFPGLFLPLAASATFVRCAALTGRGSLINGSFMQHFGRRENLGDVRAKLEVQGRWLALIGLPIGIKVFQAVSATATEAAARGDEYEAFAVAFGAYGFVIGAHCFACWKSARALKFDVLNRYRLLTLADAFVESENEALMSVEALGDVEGVYAPRVTSSTPTFGANPSEIARDWRAFMDALRLAKTRGYVLGFDPKRVDAPSAMLLESASTRDTLAAALACQKLRRLSIARAGVSRDSIRVDAYAYADARVLDFEAAMVRSGWRVDFIQIGAAPKFRLAVPPI